MWDFIVGVIPTLFIFSKTASASMFHSKGKEIKTCVRPIT